MTLGHAFFGQLCCQILAQGRPLRCRTLGTSMLPLISSRSRILVEPVPARGPRLGDIVLYRAAGILVAHRLVKKSYYQGVTALITQGDAFPRHTREYVRPDQVLGCITAVYWGSLKIPLDQGAGRLLSVGLAQLSPLWRWAYEPLRKIKQNLAPYFPH